MIVIDASAVLEVLFRTEAGLWIENRILSPEETLHVPHLIDLEVAQVVRHHCTSGEMDTQRGREVLDDITE